MTCIMHGARCARQVRRGTAGHTRLRGFTAQQGALGGEVAGAGTLACCLGQGAGAGGGVAVLLRCWGRSLVSCATYAICQYVLCRLLVLCAAAVGALFMLCRLAVSPEDMRAGLSACVAVRGAVAAAGQTRRPLGGPNLAWAFVEVGGRGGRGTGTGRHRQSRRRHAGRQVHSTYGLAGSQSGSQLMAAWCKSSCAHTHTVSMITLSLSYTHNASLTHTNTCRRASAATPRTFSPRRCCGPMRRGCCSHTTECTQRSSTGQRCRRCTR